MSIKYERDLVAGLPVIAIDSLSPVAQNTTELREQAMLTEDENDIVSYAAPVWTDSPVITSLDEVLDETDRIAQALAEEVGALILRPGWALDRRRAHEQPSFTPDYLQPDSLALVGRYAAHEVEGLLELSPEQKITLDQTLIVRNVATDHDLLFTGEIGSDNFGYDIVHDLPVLYGYSPRIRVNKNDDTTGF